MPIADQAVLRTLASRWMELASLPVMADRRRQWTALKDLRPERPMVLFETWTLLDYVPDSALQCADPLFRSVERQLRWVIRQATEVGDDLVVEPCWRLGWDVGGTGYGVDIPVHHAQDAQGDHVGFRYDHPLRTPADLDQLVPRTFSVNRESTLARRDRLAEAFGDILPVVLHGTQALGGGLTYDVFRLLGNDRLMTWTYDEPAAIHRLMRYLCDDRLAWFDFLEREQLLGLNNHWTFVGSGSPGYTTALPQPDYTGTARLKDLWLGTESQETFGISPGQFSEFFLPYMAEVAAKFGLAYYGCCEPVHDRWQQIISAIPQIRAVSISPWCDMPLIAEMLGRDVVFSRKPQPGPISGEHADWDALAQDLDQTVAAARECCLEFIYRDVYRIGEDWGRLAKWVELVRARIG